MFFPADAPVPERLVIDGVIVRPLRVADAARDHEAVLAAADTLRLRNGGDWPRPGFTLEENVADLRVHEIEHGTRAAFTYTVEDGSRTLGCVYVQPFEMVLARAGAPATPAYGGAALDPVVSFWVRPDAPPDAGARLLHALRRWFATDWPWPRVAFVANAAERALRDLLERAGLANVATFRAPDGENYLLFGDTPTDAGGLGGSASPASAASARPWRHATPRSAGIVRRRVLVSGRVQGVFFRDTCSEHAQMRGVSGWVRNLPDGRVEAVFEGEAAAVEALVEWCRRGPRRAFVAGVDVTPEPPVGERGFTVH